VDDVNEHLDNCDLRSVYTRVFASVSPSVMVPLPNSFPCIFTYVITREKQRKEKEREKDRERYRNISEREGERERERELRKRERERHKT
jgi:hypothetical protein